MTTPRHHRADSIGGAMFDQFHLPLFTPPAPTSPARRAAAAQRERSYDEAILRYVGYFRAATVHQVLFRFFIFAGKGPRYGFKAVRRLINDGLLIAKPLDPTKGTVSRQVLTLSPSGWQLLGLPQPKDPWRVAPETLLHYRLQFAEMMLVRATE